MRCSLFLQIVSVFSAVSAFCLGVAAVATFGWFEFCNGSSCLHAGLFSYRGNFGTMLRSDYLNEYGWSIGEETSVTVATAFIVGSLAFLFVGTCFTVINLATTWSERNILRVGVILYSFAVSLLVIGMILISANRTLQGQVQQSSTPKGQSHVPTTNQPTRTTTTTTATTITTATTTTTTTATTTTDGVTEETATDFFIDPNYIDLYNNLDNYFGRRRRSAGSEDLNYRSLRFGSSYFMAWASFGLSLGALVSALLAVSGLKISKDTEKKTKLPQKVTAV